jgi:hypothetical protein
VNLPAVLSQSPGPREWGMSCTVSVSA